MKRSRTRLWLWALPWQGVFALVAVLIALTSCRDVMDRLDEAEQRHRSEGEPSSEAVTTVARDRLHEGLDLDKAKALFRQRHQAARSESGPALDPLSPEGRLKAVVRLRLACQTPACRSSSLREIRAEWSEIAPGVAALLDGHGASVSMEVVRLAGLFKHAPSVPALSALLASAGGSPLRLECLWALGEIGDARAIGALELLASSTGLSLEGQRALCRAFGGIGAPQSAASVARLYGSSDAQVRVECVAAARAMGGAASAALCQRGLKDPDATVQREATLCLKSIPSSPAASAPDEPSPNAAETHDAEESP